MRKITTLLTILGLFASFDSAAGGTFTIEPDNFADGTVLNHINPRVQLAIHDGILVPDFPDQLGIFPTPAIIPLTAVTNEDILGGFFTSTGTKTFGHGGIGFTPLSRSLGMRFDFTASEVLIDVIGSSDLQETVGVLEVYDVSGQLLQVVESNPLLRQGIATLGITRAAADIKYARAYSHTDHSPFGRFDNLRFTAVPEPTFAGLWVTALLTTGWRRARDRKAI